jgi:hypothetical protein
MILCFAISFVMGLGFGMGITALTTVRVGVVIRFVTIPFMKLAATFLSNAFFSARFFAAARFLAASGYNFARGMLLVLAFLALFLMAPQS